MNISKVTPSTEKLVDEHYYAGTIDHEEVHQLQANPREFLKRASIELPEDAEIKVSVAEHPVRALAESRKGGARAIKGGEVAARAATIRRALLCRVTVVVVDSVAIVRVECIPVIVIACW